MTKFTIPNDLAELLRDIARRENCSFDDVVEKAIREYIEEHHTEVPPEVNHPFLTIAQAADKLGESSKEGDTTP